MTGEVSLPRSTPSAEGVDAAGIHAFLTAIEDAAAIEPHSLMILRHGSVVAEGWWHPFTAERPHSMHSLSKSFTSTALGFAVQEGLIDLDDRVLDHLPGLAHAGGHWESMRIRHLASMSSGHAGETWDKALAADRDDPVRGFLTLPPDGEPGTVFAYNQPTIYTVATILQQITGKTLTEYLRPRFFDPLGVDFASWQQFPEGRDAGFTGLHVTTETVAKLGEFYLRRGQWQGRALLPAEWVAEATRKHVTNAGEPNPDWQQGYGLQFWMSRHGFRGDGAFGQLCLILPEQDAVIAYTGCTSEMQDLLDKVWTHLLPAFGDAPAASHGAAAEVRSSDLALADRLARLAIPPLETRSPGSPDQDAKAVFSRPRKGSAPANPRTTTSAFEPSDESKVRVPVLVEVELLDDAEGPAIVLAESEGKLRLRLGFGEWAVSEPDGNGRVVPVAASGRWDSESVLRFDVLFLETPHRMAIECDVRSGRFDVSWTAEALRPTGLLDLHAPGSPVAWRI